MGLIDTETFTEDERRELEAGFQMAFESSLEPSVWMLHGLDDIRDSGAWDPTCHEYLRVSLDKSKREKSQRQQHDENQQHRQRNTWRAGKTYKDTGSASVYARKARGDFAQLMKDLQAGVVFKPGDILQLWESSRGSREQEEWARFLNLLRDRRVFVYVTSHGRLYDLHNPRDRRTLDEDGVDSAYESAKTSQRIRRDTKEQALLGRPHGVCPFGYKRKYNPNTGELVKQVPHPQQAKLIKELFGRLKRRESLRSIAKDWAARGIVNGSGRPFTAAHLRDMAIKPAYAGIRVHDPGRVGNKLSPAATIVKADWKPLVDKRTFFLVQRFLRAEKRRTNNKKGYRPGRAVHWLSMIAKCGVCGGVLIVRAYRYRKRGRTDSPPQYYCRTRGCVRIDKAKLDEYAETLILGYLAREDVYRALRAAEDSDDAELAAVRDELAEARAELDELARKVADGELSLAFAARTEPGLAARIGRLEKREQELITPSVLGGLITPGKDVARRWKDCGLSARREIARIVLSPELLGELQIVRVPRPGLRVPVDQRVRLVVAEDAAAA